MKRGKKRLATVLTLPSGAKRLKLEMLLLGFLHLKGDICFREREISGK